MRRSSGYGWLRRCGALVLALTCSLAAQAQPQAQTQTQSHGKVYYYYTDTLHSAVVETDAAGTVLERTYYAPFGSVLNRSLRNGPGYTGHEEDAATGLVYMQQRYYDPQAARFISTDPVQVTVNGGNFNRYWYARDNPYRYVDPFGLYTCHADFKSQCDEIKAYYDNLSKAREKAAKNTQDYEMLSNALATLGKPGEANGIIVRPFALSLYEYGDAPKGVIRLDLNQISAFASGTLLSRNPGKDVADIQNAFGASVLGHEAIHQFDYGSRQAGYPGYPATEAQDRLVEFRGLWVGLDVGLGLGINVGNATPAGFKAALDAEMSYWCEHGGACK